MVTVTGAQKVRNLYDFYAVSIHHSSFVLLIGKGTLGTFKTKKSKVGRVRYETRSRERSSPDSLAF